MNSTLLSPTLLSPASLAALSSPTLARALSNHLWQSTLFAAAVALLALTLRRYPARARYWLWLAAAAKFLVPFSLLIAAGSHLARPTHPTPTQTTAYLAIDELSQPFADSPALTPPALTATATPTPAPTHRLTLPTLLASLWLCGFLTILTRWLIQWRRIAIAIRSATPLSSGRVPETLRRIQHLARISRPIPILSSPNSMESTPMEPGVFGVLRPVLLWPEAISPHLDDAHLEAVLAHEAAHVRRRDNLTSLLPMLVEAVFWFHPLVWWIETQLVKERERACDEDVLLLCHHPQAYAESILKVCELCIESPLTCVSGITGADLKRRIVQIMTAPIARKLGLGAKLLLLSAASLAIAAPILLGQMKAAQRMMLAAADAAPTPFRTAAHAMLAPEETSSNSPVAEVQAPSTADALPQAQAEDKPFVFDVVSIRPAIQPATPVSQGSRAHAIGVQFTPDGLQASNVSLNMMLFSAYRQQLQSMSQLSGLPSWANTESFDVKAKVADSDIAEWSKLSQDMRSPAAERKLLSLRLLLAQQFKLKTHIETRVEPVYALVVAKGGLKLKPSAPEEPERLQMIMGSGHFSFSATPMGTLVLTCAHALGREVVDKTGLTGKYDFTLDWDQGAAATAPGSEPDSSAPSIFTAVQDQLGLKLEAQKGPVEYIVIDHAEKPQPMNGAALPNPPTPTLTPVSLAQQPPAPAPIAPAPAASPQSPPKSFDRLVSASLEGPAHDLGPGQGMVAWSLPVYPSEAKAAGIQGVVALKVTIANTGTVEDVQAISGPQELRQTTIDAVKQWKFDPSWDHGFSVGVKTIGVIYSLPSLVPVVGPVPPADEAAAGVKQYGGDVTVPRMVFSNDPDYTELAKTDKVEGAVTVSLVVDEQGVPQHVQVARGLGDGLDEKAVEAVKKDRFRPAKQNDKPVPVFMYLPLNFKLN